MNKPSNRSKKPPCPGRLLPESLISILRFKSDSTKSPYTPPMMMIMQIPNHCQKVSVKKKNDIPYVMAAASKAPPITPSHDFLGEIRSKSFRLPKSDPAK